MLSTKKSATNDTTGLNISQRNVETVWSNCHTLVVCVSYMFARVCDWIAQG